MGNKYLNPEYLNVVTDMNERLNGELPAIVATEKLKASATYQR